MVHELTGAWSLELRGCRTLAPMPGLPRRPRFARPGTMMTSRPFRPPTRNLLPAEASGFGSPAVPFGHVCSNCTHLGTPVAGHNVRPLRPRAKCPGVPEPIRPLPIFNWAQEGLRGPYRPSPRPGCRCSGGNERAPASVWRALEAIQDHRPSSALHPLKATACVAIPAN